MVEDKYSKNWRESQKTKETYSYLSDLTNQELTDKVNKHYETKSKEVIEIGDYFYFPIQFEDKETKKPVQMIYRYITKDKAEARANSQAAGGGKSFAPRKEYYKTFEQPIPVGLTDYQAQAEHRAKGLQVLTSEMLGNTAMIMAEDGHYSLLMGKVFKVEL